MTVARAPGRVNLIGDHTDYAGGLAFAMAIELETVAHFRPSSTTALEVVSDASDSPFLIPGSPRSSSMTRSMLEGLLDIVGPRSGTLDLTSTVPLGAGLSSSASFLVASALALGTEKGGLGLAMLCQAAEAAAGQAVGLLDQLTIIEATREHGVLIDFAAAATSLVPIPADAELTIVHSGIERSLAAGAYGERRSQVAAATDLVGPLPDASPSSIAAIDDPLLRRRARHVAEECERVRQAVSSLRTGDLEVVGQLMDESHRSLSELFDVSTSVVDDLVRHLQSRPGVYGARMTGGGFGGCVVVLSRPGALRTQDFDRAWRVAPSDGACLVG